MQRRTQARDAFAEGSAESSKRLHKSKANSNVGEASINESGHKSNSINSFDELLSVIGRSICQSMVITVILLLYLNVTSAVQIPNIIGVVSFITFATSIYNTFILYQRRHSRKHIETFERARETWEFNNFAEGEKKEMIDLYVSKGVSTVDARCIFETLGKPEYREAFVDLMMLEELNILPSSTSYEILQECATKLLSNIAGGLLPLVPLYIDFDITFYHLLAYTNVMSFICGSLISLSTLEQSVIKGGITMMVFTTSIIFVGAALML